MQDLIYLGLAAAFFIATAGVLLALERA